MPQRTLMWRVCSLTMMSRAGLSCRSKDSSVIIISALEELPSSCRSKMTGYDAKEFSWRFLLQVSANVVADFFREERRERVF